MKKFVLLICLFVLCAFVAQKWGMQQLKKPLDLRADTTIDVLYGDNIYKVAEKLKEKKVLEFPQLVTWYARFFGLAQHIKAGEYKIDANKI